MWESDCGCAKWRGVVICLSDLLEEKITSNSFSLRVIMPKIKKCAKII